MSHSATNSLSATSNRRDQGQRSRRAPALAMVAAVLVASAGAAAGVPILYAGSEHTAVGTATISPSSDGRRLVVSNLGSSGNDGVEISLRSAFGGGVTFNSTDVPNPPGAMSRTKYKGWDGTIKGLRTTTVSPAGSMRHVLDYTGTGATSVNVVVIDSTGHEISNVTTVGAVATVELAPPPCPAGSQWAWPKWYDIWVGGTHYLGNFCNDPINPIGRVVVTPHFPPGTNPDLRLESMLIEASGMAELHLSDPSFVAREGSAPSISEIVVTKPCVTGKGGVILREECDDGTPCLDDSLRKLVATNIGSSGQDGVEIKWRAPAAATSGSFDFGGIGESTGEAQILHRAVSSLPGTPEATSSLSLQGRSDHTEVRPDFSGVGSTQFQVTAYLDGAVVRQFTLPHGGWIDVGPVAQVVCGPNRVPVYGWITMWVWNPWPLYGSNQTHWGVTGCATLGSGGGFDNPTFTDRIILSPITPIATLGTTSAEVTARNLPGPIKVVSVGSSVEPGACLAGGMVDNFDTMTPGPVIAHPCWDNWDGLTNVSGTVTSGTGTGGSNSLRIDGTLNSDGQGDNVVRAVTIDGGRSTFTTNIRVPSGTTGTGFIALMDQYSAAALHLGAWLVVDGNNNTVRNVVNNLHRATLVRDQWVPLRIEVDMVADTVAAYYNNQLLFSGQSWLNGTSFPGSAPTGLNRIVGLALFSGDPTEPGLTDMSFDDMSLLPVTPPACPADVNGDGVADGSDFIAFINSFATGDVAVDPIADINHDGTIDGDDYITFINGFSAGC